MIFKLKFANYFKVGYLHISGVTEMQLFISSDGTPHSEYPLRSLIALQYLIQMMQPKLEVSSCPNHTL